MTEENYIEKQGNIISVQIFSVSAAMVGVCLTVIGIINLISSDGFSKTLADDITMVGAILFLSACIFAYFGIRSVNRKKRLLLEKISDVFFLSGLGTLVIVCIFIVYKLDKYTHTFEKPKIMEPLN